MKFKDIKEGKEYLVHFPSGWKSRPGYVTGKNKNTKVIRLAILDDKKCQIITEKFANDLTLISEEKSI